MTNIDDMDTDQLLNLSLSGQRQAEDALFSRHRDRLRRMVGVRLDPAMHARIDPSDIVQETLAEAHRRLPEFGRGRPLPFYPWLRQLAWQQLVVHHRRHVVARSRSVDREQTGQLDLPAQSTLQLAGLLAASQASPSAEAQREEERVRVLNSLSELAEGDREVLVLRFLEQLSVKDVAAVLDISTDAVQMRQLRALRRLKVLHS